MNSKIEKDVITLVGAGAGGSAILNLLLDMPGVEVRHVVDVDPQAPGIKLAQEHGIHCHIGSCPPEVAGDPEVDLMFEVTGKDEVIRTLREIRHPNCSVLGASGTKIIFHLLDAQNQVNQKLQEYQGTLESKIIERTEELARANEELQKQIFEHERLNKQLQEINEEKTRYLLQATHQLKAPFAAIQSYADVILEGFAGPVPKQIFDILKKIKKRCELLTNSIREMLELASLKTTLKDSLEKQVISVGDLISDAIKPFRDVAKKRNIKIRYVQRPENLWIRGNRDQMITMLSVLLENALNYSDDGKLIECVVERPSRNWASISIKDQGIGIPEENIPKIFKEHFRSNNAVVKHENGSGLGLAIVKEILELHNFNIVVESRLGEGSEFTVSVPLVENV